MRPLSAADLLNVWERGLSQSPVQRALSLLAAACSDTPAEGLMQLSIGQRDARLLSLREWAFGPQLVGVATCPACDEQLEMVFNVADIRVSPSPPGSPVEEVETFTLNIADYAVSFRVPNSHDLGLINDQTDVEAARRLLFERCVLSAQRDGTDVSVTELPGDVTAALVARMAETDPQAEVQLTLTCPACGHYWQATFDIVSFFWQEIHDWAQRILREVHVLASAYGWREADILALSPRRRQFYLELVG